MRNIPTSDALVERLRKQAKKLQRAGGGKHSDLLNRVAKSAGYDHWHHVIQCQELSKGSKSVVTLKSECNTISRAEIDGDVRVVFTGPEIGAGPFILFSSGIGDAWLLDPEANLAMCLVWHSQKITPDIQDDPKRLHISWDGEYELLGDFFRVKTNHPEIGERAIAGYPLDGLREMIHRAHSFEKKFDAVIARTDSVDMTPDVIAQMARKGWGEAELLKMREDGFRYSPSRDSIISPVMSSDDFDEKADE